MSSVVALIAAFRFSNEQVGNEYHGSGFHKVLFNGFITCTLTFVKMLLKQTG